MQVDINYPIEGPRRWIDPLCGAGAISIRVHIYSV